MTMPGRASRPSRSSPTSILRQFAERSVATLTLIGCVATVSTATRQSAALVFTGELRFGPAFDVAGRQRILVLAGRSLQDLVICGQNETDENGRFSIYVLPRHPNCSDEGHNGGRGPVPYIFSWNGQNIGVRRQHLRRSDVRDRLVRTDLVANVGPFPSSRPPTPPDDRWWDMGRLEPGDPLLVVLRFYGFVRPDRAGRRPRLTQVTSGTFPCGQAIIRGDGSFVLDILPVEPCSCPTSTARDHPRTLEFRIDDEVVHRTTVHLHWDHPWMLGKGRSIQLTPRPERQ